MSWSATSSVSPRRAPATQEARSGLFAKEKDCMTSNLGYRCIEVAYSAQRYTVNRIALQHVGYQTCSDEVTWCSHSHHRHSSLFVALKISKLRVAGTLSVFRRRKRGPRRRACSPCSRSYRSCIGGRAVFLGQTGRDCLHARFDTIPTARVPIGICGVQSNLVFLVS